MNETDELGALRRLVPTPPDRHLPAERRDHIRQALLAEVTRGRDDGAVRLAVGSRRTRGRAWRRLALFAFVPVALLGGAVAYSTTAHRTAEQLGNEATCFAAPALDAPAAGAPFTGQDLGAFCRQQWTAGSIASPVPGPAPTEWVACVAESGGVDVFPSGDQDLCASLGLQPLPPGYFEAVPRYAGLEADLFGRFPDSGCTSREDALAVARRILDTDGYSGWGLETTGFGDVTPCAKVDLDPVNGVATLVGWVRPDLEVAVQRGLEQTNYCGPQDDLLRNVQRAVTDAGFADWQVTIDHTLTAQWPCVAGSRIEPASRTIVLAGHATD